MWRCCGEEGSELELVVGCIVCGQEGRWIVCEKKEEEWGTYIFIPVAELLGREALRIYYTR